MPKITSQPQLTREDWADAALNVIAIGGTDAVSVEQLAKALGVTKGSFYWHFTNRTELIQAALNRWESAATTTIIDQLAKFDDPLARLRALLVQTMGEGTDGRSESAIFGSTNDPIVKQSVVAVNRARQLFLKKIFIELGHQPGVAETRARIAYAAYLGHVTLQTTDTLTRRSADSFINELMKTLTE
jgi:AcrR family transcriptional regulator